MKIDLKEYILEKRQVLLAVALGLLIYSLVLLLYQIPPEAAGYGILLVFIAEFVWLLSGFGRFRKKQKLLRQLAGERAKDFYLRDLPESEDPKEEAYQDLIESLLKEKNRKEAEAAEKLRDMEEYYTLWVHQIKTPMAVMKLYLGTESPEHRAMGTELFRMEQYVDMVLQYLRLSSGENDLVIREYKLDELIREAVRKYAAQFVLKKLRLTYIPTEISVVTDRKWFGCILEQLLSNAIKYTPAGGSIAICVGEDALHISDTGIGIAPEDLPRIFEKGYTGENGRLERTSSGLGLYLAGKAADMLHIPIHVESTVGRGTAFTLHLRQK